MSGEMMYAHGEITYENDNSSNSENESPERRGQRSTRLNARVRRLRANDRERRRIQSINGAMEALRRAIPNTKDNTKITKLQLLRLAQDYIRTLSEILTHANAAESTAHGAARTFDVQGLLPYVSYAEEAGVGFYTENQVPCGFAYGFVQAPEVLPYSA